MEENTIVIYPNLAEAAAAAASEIARLSAEAIAERGKFTLALSGGSTPQELYEILARDYKDTIDWKNVHLFWGDERYVPHNDQASNFRLVKESLLDFIQIPAENIFPIPTDDVEPEVGAQTYAATLQSAFGENLPTFDLILLGLGPDGHTASLFPGMDLEQDADKLAIVTNAPFVPPVRISLTLAVINHARQVFFLVSGKEKAGILREVLESRGDAKAKYPAARVEGDVRWFVEEDAAELL